MAGSLKDVVSEYQKLIQEWNKKDPNLEKCGKILADLKVRSQIDTP